MKTTKQELAILAVGGIAILGIKIIEQRYQIRRLVRSNKLKNEVLENLIAYMTAIENGQSTDEAGSNLIEQLKFIEIAAKENF